MDTPGHETINLAIFEVQNSGSHKGMISIDLRNPKYKFHDPFKARYANLPNPLPQYSIVNPLHRKL